MKSNENDFLNFQEIFKEQGHRFTLPRKVILEVLQKRRDHPSAEEIYHEVHKQSPSIGITTVYRTLELLINWSLVHKFDFGDKRARYELINKLGAKTHHHHLICNNCKKIINYYDFSDSEIKLLDEIQNHLSQKFDFVITNHMVKFYGFCRECEEKK